MFKGARLAKIKDILLERTQIDVQTLSLLLDVSAVTIRSDLAQLEDEGFLVRTHGGAILNDSGSVGLPGYEPPHSRRIEEPRNSPAIEYSKSREVIGQIADHLIDENEWIFLGPGATCYYIAKALLLRADVNILTNNIYIADLMGARRGGEVVVTGGTLYRPGMFLYGDMFARDLSVLHINKAFLSVGGADLEHGYSVDGMPQASIHNLIKNVCGELYLVIDASKFDQTSFMRIGDLEMGKTVVTNDDIPEKYKEFYFTHGVRLFMSYDIKKSTVR